MQQYVAAFLAKTKNEKKKINKIANDDSRGALLQSACTFTYLPFFCMQVTTVEIKISQQKCIVASIYEICIEISHLTLFWWEYVFLGLFLIDLLPYFLLYILNYTSVTVMEIV